MHAAHHKLQGAHRDLTTCLICRREAETSSTLCANHLTAKKNLESAFKQWSDAYGGMKWEEYLRLVQGSPETGQWVKEVAALLSKAPVP